MIRQQGRDTKGHGLRRTTVFPLRVRPFLFSLAVAIVLSTQARSQGLHGQVSSELYSYRDSSVTHLRPYLRLLAGATPWTGTRGQQLEFHVNARWTDANAKHPVDPRLYVYDAYLHATNLLGRTEAYFGRQFVFNGVGSGLLDGLRLKYRAGSRLQFDVFGGSGVASNDPEKIQSPGTSALIGGRIATNPTPRLNFGLNWLYRTTDDRTAVHRAGFDIEQRFTRWRLYGRGVYDISWLRLGELTSRVSFSGQPWYVSVEGSWREPSVAAAGIFSILDFKRYQTVRVDGRRTISNNLALTAELFSRLQSGEDSYRLGVGLARGAYTLGWHYQTGSSGDNSGLHGSASIHLAHRWDGYAAANVSRYRIQEDADLSDAYASQLGLIWRPVNGWNVTAEGQFLRNAIATSQARLYFRLTKDFSSNMLGQRTGL